MQARISNAHELWKWKEKAHTYRRETGKQPKKYRRSSISHHGERTRWLDLLELQPHIGLEEKKER